MEINMNLLEEIYFIKKKDIRMIVMEIIIFSIQEIFSETERVRDLKFGM